MVDATSSKTWKGKKYYVVQIRGSERLWSGNVRVHRSGETCYGTRKASDAAPGQWKVGDIIVQGDENTSVRWDIGDTIALGANDDMFDETILRLSRSEYSSITTSVDALNLGEQTCREGMCIAYSDSQSEYYLLVRADKKACGMRVFCAAIEQKDLQKQPEPENETPFILGQRVNAAGESGFVRFVGRTKLGTGTWVGIELDIATGKTDGSVDGVSYFKCGPRHGIFLRPEQVKFPKRSTQPAQRRATPATWL